MDRWVFGQILARAVVLDRATMRFVASGRDVTEAAVRFGRAGWAVLRRRDGRLRPTDPGRIWYDPPPTTRRSAGTRRRANAPAFLLAQEWRLRAWRAGGYPMRTIATQFGTSATSVWRACHQLGIGRYGEQTCPEPPTTTVRRVP